MVVALPTLAGAVVVVVELPEPELAAVWVLLDDEQDATPATSTPVRAMAATRRRPRWMRWFDMGTFPLVHSVTSAPAGQRPAWHTAHEHQVTSAPSG